MSAFGTLCRGLLRDIGVHAHSKLIEVGCDLMSWSQAAIGLN